MDSALTFDFPEKISPLFRMNSTWKIRNVFYEKPFQIPASFSFLGPKYKKAIQKNFSYSISLFSPYS